MKPYGIPRTDDIENPDVADIHEYGLKSRTGRFDERGYQDAFHIMCSFTTGDLRLNEFVGYEDFKVVSLEEFRKDHW